MKTVSQREKEAKEKVAKAKEKVIENVEKLNRDKLSTKPEEKTKAKTKEKDKKKDDRTWLEKYLAGGRESGAKIVTQKLTQGATLEELSTLALSYAKKHGSSWGSPGNIKSHMGYLKGKGVVIEEPKQNFFKIKM